MLRWIDGFEHYGAIARMTEGVGGGAAWSQADVVTNGGWALSTSSPATGSYHMRLTQSSAAAVTAKQLRRIFGVASQVVGFGYRFSVTSLPSGEGASDKSALILADFRDVSNVSHCTIVMGTDGSVFALRGAQFTSQSIVGTLLGRSDPCIAAGGYHHIEMKVKIDNTTGYIEVRVNEVTVLNLTGIDTQNTANASAAQVSVGQSGNVLADPAGFGTFDLDDPFAWDDDASDAENTVVDWVGDKGCYYLKPNADTATSGWTRSAGSTNYTLIDEVPPGGIDYLTDATGSAKTIVQVEALPGNVSEVIAFMPVIYARKEDSGSVTLRGGVAIGADESYGPDDSPSTAYAYLRPGPKTIDPDTGVAWANTANPDLIIERTA